MGFKEEFKKQMEFQKQLEKDGKKSCIHCQTIINKNDKKCHKCGKNQTSIIAVIILIIIILSLTYFFFGRPLYTRDTPDIPITAESFFNQNTGVAKNMCKNAINKQLKTPSTANFSNMKAIYTGAEGSEATVGGFVDSDNSFGATLRKQINCTFTWTGNDYKLKEANIWE